MVGGGHWGVWELTCSRERQAGRLYTSDCQGFFGDGSPVHLLLEYADSSYEEKKYTIGDGNGILAVF